MIKGAADLDKLYQEAEQCDKQEFAKMRSSLLLIAGEHYNKKGNKFFDRIRVDRNLDEQSKIRLTKNHLGRIARRYSNLIVTAAPGVSIGPKHKKELQDTKAAEINQAIWQDAKEKNNWTSTIMQWADDFVGIGEVWTKVYWDEFAGKMLGYEQQVDEAGLPVTDMNGEPVPDTSKPRYQGELRFEEIFAFNVLRDPSSQNVKESPWYCIRKSVSKEKLEKMFPGKTDKINAGVEQPFLVFDVSHGYRKSEDKEVMIREWYFRPSFEHPNGYYYISIPGSILDEGELPNGIFPLEMERFDNIQTKCRGMAATEPLRPNQAEINRCASKIAEHQITLGDDRLIMQNGAKLSASATLPGIRALTVSGPMPEVLQGRSGSQYIDYMLAQIKEMYELAEIDDEEVQANLEPHTLLYRAASQKRKFARYVQRFEGFLRRVCSLYLRMAKYYYDEETFVLAVGRNEQVNITEFKNTNDQSVEIIIEPQADDVETKLGRQLVLTNVLQYVGGQINQEMIGKLIRQMPYANVQDAFTDLTLDDESATNDLLALDRGDMPMISPTDSHDYLVKRAMNRMRQSDFKLLHPQIQANYKAYVDAHLQAIEEQKQALIRANSGFVPDGGALVGCDFFVQDPNNPERTRRARIPYDALSWLMMKLEDQGSFKKMAGELPDGAIQMAEQGQPMATGSNAEVSSAPPPSPDQL